MLPLSEHFEEAPCPGLPEAALPLEEINDNEFSGAGSAARMNERLGEFSGALNVERWPGQDVIKRATDVAGAIAALILFGPLMALVALVLKLQGGPIVFAHERLGRNGKPFPCFKFRTMVVDAEAKLEALLQSDPEARSEWERDHKLQNDPRITRIGAVLRETSLDELPQFFNVLRGEMSLVGPRPITRSEVVKYGKKFFWYMKCRPGITGIWQVSGRNDVSYEERVDLDMDYALTQAFWRDVSIMLRTVGVVLSKTGAR